MNSEELELSLRTEFESYLKGVLADIRQDVSEFQKNFESEFEKHKSQTDEAFRNLFKRFESGPQFDQSFSESVVEHLRLARDDGATITAAAIGEAEKLKEAAGPPAEFDKLRDGINEISSKTSQSEILKALVEAAGNFAPRGAFFIVKNEQFVGWKAFGNEAKADESTVRGIQFPTASDTILAEAVASLSTASGSHGKYAEDEQFLDTLGFGKPDRMHAIPLTARGRGVAVLYADYGSEGFKLNPEALETLVRVAGLTVELAASAPPMPAPQAFAPEPQPAAEPEAEPEAAETQVVEEPTETFEDVPAEETAAPVDEEAADEAPQAAFEEYTETPVASFEEYTAAEEPAVEEVEEYVGPVSFEKTETEDEPQAAVPEAAAEPDAVTFEPTEEEEPVAFERFGSDAFESPAESESVAVEDVTYFEPVEDAAEPGFTELQAEPEPALADPFEAVAEAKVEEAPVERADEYVPQADHSNGVGNGAAPHVATEPLAEVATAQAARTRYRDRNIDLPIEVAEDEKRLHNDARRFARLLVSEIKLYNEQKVSEGRQSADLYDRLREAIDRSRDMYDKRVQQPVAERFDYFHYELVNSLAEGEDVKLGATYPGARVPA